MKKTALLFALGFAIGFTVVSNAFADTLSDAQTNAMGDYGILSLGGFVSPSNFCFVTSTGGLVHNGSFDTTGTAFKACFEGYGISGGITTSGELKYFNGSSVTTGSDFVRVGRTTNGWNYAVRSDGSTYRFGNGDGGDVLSGVLKAQWYGGAFVAPDNYPGCTVFSDGSASCKNYFGGTLFSGGTDVVDAEVEYPGYAGGYAVLHSDGSITSNFTFSDGPYRSVSAGYWTGDGLVSKVCATRRNGLVDCKNSGASWLTDNQPSFAVRNVVVGDAVAYAVKLSDSTLWKWDASGLSQVGSSSVGGGSGETETVTSDGLSCVTTYFPNINDVSWMSPGFFSLTGSFTRTDYVGGSQYACNDHITYSTCGDKITVYNKTEDGLSLDRFNAYNYSPEDTLIFSGSWRYPGTGNRSVMVRDPDYSRYMVALGSIRDGSNVLSNVFQFFSVANPSSTIPWSGVWDPGSRVWESVWAGTGGIATIAYPFGVSDIILQMRDISVPPIGFRRGTANSYVTKTDCSKGNNQCRSYLVGTGMVCAGANVNGYLGNCAFDSSNRCAPVKRSDGSFTSGVSEEGSNVIHDSQGNVVAVIPKSSAINPGSGKADGDSIFHCDEDEGYISCVLHVLRNGWAAINDTFSSAGSVGNSVEGSTSRIGSGSTGSLYTGTFATGADQYIGNRIIGGGWNVISGDAGNDPLKLLAQRIWTSAIFVLFIFSMFLLYVVIRHRKDSNPDA